MSTRSEAKKELEELFKIVDLDDKSAKIASEAVKISYDRGYEDGHSDGFFRGVVTVGITALFIGLLRGVANAASKSVQEEEERGNTTIVVLAPKKDEDKAA